MLAGDAAVVQHGLALLHSKASRDAGQDLDVKVSTVHIDADLALAAAYTIDLGTFGVDLGIRILQLDLAGRHHGPDAYTTV